MIEHGDARTTYDSNPRLAGRVKPNVLARFRWIETALRAGERIDAGRYTEYFSVSRPMLSQDLRSFSEMVNWLGGVAEPDRGGVAVEQWPSDGCAGCFSPLEWHRLNAPETVEDVEVQRLVDPTSEVQDAISSSIRRKVPLRADYTSTTSGARSVLLSPHHIVNAIGRSHVRAFDHDRNDFRDFVLARMTATRAAPSIPYVSSATDADWHEFVNVRLQVASCLDPDRRLAIAIGVGLDSEDDEVVFACRRCLVDYQLLARGIRPAHYTRFFDVSVSEPSETYARLRHCK